MKAAAPAMKIILVASLFAWAPLVRGQGTDTEVPTQLAEARAHYEAAIATATKPIRERYLQELEQLRAAAFSTKDANLAFAVSQEIALLGGTGTGGTEIDGADPSTVDDVKERLVNTTWVWYAGETITFLKDGMARWSGNHAEAFTWKVAGATPPVIEGKAWNGNKYRLTLDAGLRTGKLVEGTLHERPASQIDFK